MSGFGVGADVAPQPGATTSHRSSPAEAPVVVGEVGVWAQPAARNAAQINAYFTSASFIRAGDAWPIKLQGSCQRGLKQNTPDYGVVDVILLKRMATESIRR